MSCGVNIPLSSVVEAIVNDYADVFVGEILKRVSLHNSTINNGTFTDATIRGGLTLDDTAKGALCSALQDCIATKIQDELGCERDNHVTDFALTDKHLVITLKFGEVFRISKQELADFIGNITNNSGGITGGTLTNDTTITVNNKDGSTATIDISGLDLGGITGGTLTNDTTITVDNKDGSTATIDISGLDLGGITGGTLTNDTTITVNNKDGSTATIDISGLDLGDKDTNTYPTHGEVVNNTTVRIHLNTGGYIDIDASTLASKNSPFIVSGVFVSRDGGYWLDFTRNDNTKVNVDMTAIINELVNTLRTQILGMGYTLKTENNHYTTQAEDFNGFTIIRANHNGDQTITLTKPDDSFIGKALIVRKTNGGVGTFVTLKAGGGVTISPADSTPLRRVGSSATLVYTGGGNWDVFGELP